MLTTAATLPSASQYSEAIQNPGICFFQPSLRAGKLALDHLGLPLVMAGNFAVVFKLRLPDRTCAVKCFCRFLGDRESRFIAIHKQLSSLKSSRLTGFEYLSHGILVGGKRYPVLLMEWIEGPTLNAYIDEVLTTNSFYQALQSLAEDWCRVVKELEDCQIAHGDLQHGNIIVTQEGIRLVDLDGAFVPGLTGQKSAELGHIHFQHPLRTAEQFNSGLDRFSSLVIYLSIIAIAKTPSLWKRFHDENLIFKRDDFAYPSRSVLFQTLMANRGKVAQLAEILKKACLDSPSNSPRLSDLVTVPEQSKLPNWMHGSPPVVVVETKTREASDRNMRYVPGIDWGSDNEQSSSRQSSSTFPSPSTTNFPAQYPLPNAGYPPRAPHSSSTSTPPAQPNSSQTSPNPQTELVVLENVIAPVLMGLGIFWSVIFSLLGLWGLLTLFRAVLRL